MQRELARKDRRIKNLIDGGATFSSAAAPEGKEEGNVCFFGSLLRKELLKCSSVCAIISIIINVNSFQI